MPLVKMCVGCACPGRAAGRASDPPVAADVATPLRRGVSYSAFHAEKLGAGTAHAGCTCGRLSAGDQAASEGNHGSRHAAMMGFAGLNPSYRLLICPNQWIVKPHSQKYSVFQNTQISSISTASPPRHKGRFAIVRNVVRGDAVDARGTLDETCRSGRRRRVVLTPQRRRQAGVSPPATVSKT
jgi:hypothetical protein